MFLSLLSRLSLAFFFFFFFFFLCLGVLVVLSVQQTCRQSTGTTDGWAHNHTLCFFCDKLRLLLLQMGNQETREGRRELPNAQTRNNPSYLLATVTVERNLVSGVDPILKQASLLLLPWVASSHQSWDCGWDDDKARVHKESSGLVSAERHRQSGERYFPTLLCINLINPQRITDFFVLQSLMMRVVHKPHKPQRMIDFFVLQSLMMMRVA